MKELKDIVLNKKFIEGKGNYKKIKILKINTRKFIKK